MRDVEFNQQFPVRSAHDHVWHDGAEPVFQERCIEPIVSARVEGLPLTITMDGRQNERQFGGEQVLGEPVQGGLWTTVTRALSGRAVMPEVVLDLVTFAGHQKCSTAWAMAAASQAGTNLRDMGKTTVNT
jgi:hypothetical protein